MVVGGSDWMGGDWVGVWEVCVRWWMGARAQRHGFVHGRVVAGVGVPRQRVHGGGRMGGEGGGWARGLHAARLHATLGGEGGRWQRMSFKDYPTLEQRRPTLKWAALKTNSFAPLTT